MMDVTRANLLALEGEWRGFRAYNVGTGLGTDVNQLERGLRQALAKVLSEQGRGKDRPAATYSPPWPGTCAPASWTPARSRGNWAGARR